MDVSVEWLKDSLITIPQIHLFASVLWTVQTLSLTSLLERLANMAMTILLSINLK